MNDFRGQKMKAGDRIGFMQQREDGTWVVGVAKITLIMGDMLMVGDVNGMQWSIRPERVVIL